MTDFNDLHVSCGLPEVEKQLLAAVGNYSASAETPSHSDCPPEPSDTRSVDEGYEAYLQDAPPPEFDDYLPDDPAFFSASDPTPKPPATRSGLEGYETFPENAKSEELDLAPPNLDWMRSLHRTNNGNYKASLYNALIVLRFEPCWQGVLGYCDFSYRVVKLKPPPFGGELGEWQDVDTARLRAWMDEKYGFAPKTSDADDAVLVIAEENRFHPVRNYLNSLVWDGHYRLSTWMHTYLGAACSDESADADGLARYTKYVEQVSRMWMIAAVARVMRPPVKVDNVLILEGKQGKGKSTCMNILGGDEGWFSDTHFALGEKDGYQQMQGLWICELAELDAFNKAESTKAKQFFGSSEDRYRPAYGRRTVKFARQCVFVGTTNQDNYLKDPTGNRRYWPVYVTKIDNDALARDRDQLWAEALHAFHSGEQWWVNPENEHLFSEQQEQRFSGDAWLPEVQAWLDDTKQDKERYTTGDIMYGALRMDREKWTPPNQTRIGNVMKKVVGWKKRRLVVTPGKPERDYFYVRVPRD